jgi:hypothetical protein
VWKRVAVRHGRAFVQHVVPAVAKPARILWNEVIGFVFLCFAVIFGFRTGHYAVDYFRDADAAFNFGRMLVAGFCTLLTGWFALTSFLRARRITRS